MQKINEQLLKLRDTINASKEEFAFKKGQLEVKMKELKEVHGVKTVDDAMNEIDRLEEKKIALEKDIEKQYESIRKDYPW